MADSSDQRDEQRIPVDKAVEYRVPATETEGVGRMVDLSEGGVQFRAEASIEPGSQVSLKIPPGGEGRPMLRVAGHVVRCQPEDDAFRIACSFD